MTTTTRMDFYKPVKNGEATSVLRGEHEAVLHVLSLLEKAIGRQKQGGEVPSSFFGGVLEVLTLFVDRCHHTKEEEVLFPLLREGGIPQENGPIGCMLDEHQEGRELISQMQRGYALMVKGEADGKALFTTGAQDYIELMRLHIKKENNVLFLMADSVLQPAAQHEIAELFEKVEEEKMGAGTHERLHGVIDNLGEQAAAW